MAGVFHGAPRLGRNQFEYYCTRRRRLYSAVTLAKLWPQRVTCRSHRTIFHAAIFLRSNGARSRRAILPMRRECATSWKDIGQAHLCISPPTRPRLRCTRPRFRGRFTLRQTGLLCVKTAARLSCLSSRDGNSSRVSLTTAVDWIAIERLRAVKKTPLFSMLRVRAKRSLNTPAARAPDALVQVRPRDRKDDPA